MMPSFTENITVMNSESGLSLVMRCLVSLYFCGCFAAVAESGNLSNGFPAAFCRNVANAI